MCVPEVSREIVAFVQKSTGMKHLHMGSELKMEGESDEAVEQCVNFLYLVPELYTPEVMKSKDLLRKEDDLEMLTNHLENTKKGRVLKKRKREKNPEVK